jgi:hypothetical protein
MLGERSSANGGVSYRTVTEVLLLGFSGMKEDWEIDPRKNMARRLVAHSIKMMRGGYRLLPHYPIKTDGHRARSCVVYSGEMQNFILQEIRRLASANGGQAPGQKLFAKETGIAEHQWRGRYWARWGDALREAGFAPNDWNGKSNANAVLSGVITACRYCGHLPTQSELEALRRTDPSVPHPNVVRSNFGGRSDMIAALAKHIETDAALFDVAAMLPEQSNDALQRRPSSKSIEGFMYLIKSGDFYKIGRSDDAE